MFDGHTDTDTVADTINDPRDRQTCSALMSYCSDALIVNTALTTQKFLRQKARDNKEQVVVAHDIIGDNNGLLFMTTEKLVHNYRRHVDATFPVGNPIVNERTYHYLPRDVKRFATDVDIRRKTLLRCRDYLGNIYLGYSFEEFDPSMHTDYIDDATSISMFYKFASCTVDWSFISSTDLLPVTVKF